MGGNEPDMVPGVSVGPLIIVGVVVAYLDTVVVESRPIEPTT